MLIFQRKFLNIVVALSILGATNGCVETTKSNYLSVPVSVSSELPFRYKARLWQYYGGDSFELVDGGAVHFVMIEGISTPGSHQSFHEEAKQHALKLIQGKTIAVEVIGYDKLKRELAHVSGFNEKGKRTNLGLSLLENGLAWFDQSDGDYKDAYVAAETAARQKGIGIWSEENPVPPWEAWESRVELLKDLSK